MTVWEAPGISFHEDSVSQLLQDKEGLKRKSESLRSFLDVYMHKDHVYDGKSEFVQLSLFYDVMNGTDSTWSQK